MFHSPSSRTSWFKDILKESKVTRAFNNWDIDVDFKFVIVQEQVSGIIWMRKALRLVRPGADDDGLLVRRSGND